MTKPILDSGNLEHCLRAGMSIDEIADYFGVSHSTVWRRRRDFGLRHIRPGDLHPHDSPEQIKACLTCERASCSGTCKTIKELAR